VGYVVALPKPDCYALRRWKPGSALTICRGALTPVAATQQLSTAEAFVSKVISLLSEDAGKNPANPLWQVGVAKLGWLLALLLAFRCLQPHLDKRVRLCEEERQRSQDEAAASVATDTFDEQPSRATHSFSLALMKALQTTSRALVPIIMGLVAFEMLSDYVEDVIFVWRASEHLCIKALAMFNGEFLQRATYVLDKATQVLVLAFGGQFLITLKDQLVQQFLQGQMVGGELKQRSILKTVVSMSAYVNYIIYAIVGVTAVAAFGIDVRPLLAIGGVSGLAIGLGAKELASAILGCLQLLISNQFQAGDVVEMRKDRNIILKGTVVSISPFRTKFVALHDNRVPWTIPNQDLTKMMISNRSRLLRSSSSMKHLNDLKETRKIHLKMGVTFPEDTPSVPDIVPEIMDMIKKTANRHPETAEASTVAWETLKDIDATFEVVAFLDVAPARYDIVKAEAIALIDKALRERGCLMKEFSTVD